jgi:hypothetical protein
MLAGAQLSTNPLSQKYNILVSDIWSCFIDNINQNRQAPCSREQLITLTTKIKERGIHDI